jgi:hypothetical protein
VNLLVRYTSKTCCVQCSTEATGTTVCKHAPMPHRTHAHGNTQPHRCDYKDDWFHLSTCTRQRGTCPAQLPSAASSQPALATPRRPARCNLGRRWAVAYTPPSTLHILNQSSSTAGPPLQRRPVSKRTSALALHTSQPGVTACSTPKPPVTLPLLSHLWTLQPAHTPFQSLHL